MITPEVYFIRRKSDGQFITNSSGITFAKEWQRAKEMTNQYAIEMKAYMVEKLKVLADSIEIVKAMDVVALAEAKESEGKDKN